MSNPEKFYSPTPSQSEEADSLVEKRNITYEQAYDMLGVKAEQSKVEHKGASIKLADRAILLARTLSLDLKASRVDGFTRKLDSEFDDQPRVDSITHNNKNYNFGDVARISKGGSNYRRVADSMFHKAFGVSEMIEAGINDNLADDMAQTGANKFYDKYTGPANEKARNQFKKVLKKQANQ